LTKSNGLLITGLLLILVQISRAHEPLFGLGPHTIYKYGYALESELEKSAEGWTNHLELLYGLTPDWAITATLPLQLENNHTVGNVSLRTKYRFYRQDLTGASKQAALHAGVFLPSQKAVNATDFFVGLSYGYESRRHYFFSGLRYRFNGNTKRFKRPDKWLFDVAYGIRPWLLEYLQPDPVFLLELNGESLTSRDGSNASTVQKKNFLISLSPGLLFSYRNLMFKAGAKIPVFSSLKSQTLPAVEYVLGLEFHFPPLR